MSTTIAYNKYKIIDKIGEGAFGSIMKGLNIRTGEKVAIKVEPIELQMLINETKIYHYLRGLKGIPSVKWFGKDEKNYYMVLSLLGDSLQTRWRKKGKLDKKLCLQIGIEIMDILENIHEKGMVHRDIKPDNFLLGLEDNELFIIDFGFCVPFSQSRLEPKTTHSLIGTPKYASLNAHDKIELTRRDDLESLAYMLCFFFLGDIQFQNEHDIITFKTSLVRNEIKEVPFVFIQFLQVVREISFLEKPKYFLLKNIFRSEL